MNKLLKALGILIFLAQAVYSSPEKLSVKEDFLSQFVQLAESKFSSLENQNLVNEANGESYLNQYVVYLNCAELSSTSPWAGSLSASLSESQLSGLNNEIIKNFDLIHNKESKKARFYVLYVDNFPVMVEQNMEISSYADLKTKLPFQAQEMEAKASDAVKNAISTIYSRVPELKNYQSWVAYTTGTVVGIKNEKGSKKVVAKRGFFSFDSGGLQEKSKCYLKSTISNSKDSHAPFERIRIRVGKMQAGFNNILNNDPAFLNFSCRSGTDINDSNNSRFASKSTFSEIFLSHVEKQQYNKSEIITKLLDEISKELDKRHEVLLKDYGKIQVENLSSIEKIFFIESQQITEHNLNKYLSLLQVIEAGAKKAEEKILSLPDADYESLRIISRLTSIDMAEFLTWEARKKLLLAWAEKKDLADNGWLGYDERKVIELLAKAPRKNSQNLMDFFKEKDYAYLLKFYKNLDNWGLGNDNNTLFIETLTQISKQLLDEKLATTSGNSETEKLLNLWESGYIKGFFFDIASSDCESFSSFSETEITSYKITSKWCNCQLVRKDGHNSYFRNCTEKLLSEETLSPFDFAIIIKGKDLSLLYPENFIQENYQAEVVPGIYFKYLKKEKNIKLATDLGKNALAIASFAIPGTIMIRAAMAGNYLAATIAGADLVVNGLAEVTSSEKVAAYMITRYGEANTKAALGTLHSVSILTGNVNGPVNAAKSSRLADNLIGASKKINPDDLKITLSILDDIKDNSHALVKNGDFAPQQIKDLENSSTFIRSDLARANKAVGKVEVVKGAGRLADNIHGTLKATFDDLVFEGVKYVDNGSSIKFFDDTGSELAVIADSKFTPVKWTLQRKSNGILVSHTDEGYKVIKNGNDYAFELGYKEGRTLSAEEVNVFHKAIGNHEPYKPLTTVIERNLQPGDKIYIVEYANGGAPNPGGWGSKNQINSLKEVREDFAILNDWKDLNKDKLVLREYIVKKPLPVRDGVIGPLQETSGANVGTVYFGNQQQYEFIEYLGGEKWKDFLSNPIEHILK